MVYVVFVKKKKKTLQIFGGKAFGCQTNGNSKPSTNLGRTEVETDCGVLEIVLYPCINALRPFQFL